MGWIEGTESISIYHFKFFRENCVIENFVWKKINKKIFPARYFQQWTFISLKSHCVLQNCTQNALNRQYGFRSRPKRLVKVIECSISVVCTLKHMRRFEIEGYLATASAIYITINFNEYDRNLFPFVPYELWLWKNANEIAEENTIFILFRIKQKCSYSIIPHPGNWNTPMRSNKSLFDSISVQCVQFFFRNAWARKLLCVSCEWNIY